MKCSRKGWLEPEQRGDRGWECILTLLLHIAEAGMDPILGEFERYHLGALFFRKKKNPQDYKYKFSHGQVNGKQRVYNPFYPLSQAKG